MKLKKLIVGLCVALVAALACVGFAACGGDGGEGGNGGGSNLPTNKVYTFDSVDCESSLGESFDEAMKETIKSFYSNSKAYFKDDKFVFTYAGVEQSVEYRVEGEKYICELGELSDVIFGGTTTEGNYEMYVEFDDATLKIYQTITASVDGAYQYYETFIMTFKA